MYGRLYWRLKYSKYLKSTSIFKNILFHTEVKSNLENRSKQVLFCSMKEWIWRGCFRLTDDQQLLGLGLYKCAHTAHTYTSRGLHLCVLYEWVYEYNLFLSSYKYSIQLHSCIYIQIRLSYVKISNELRDKWFAAKAQLTAWN